MVTVDAGLVVEVWGDSVGAQHPGTVEDTFININSEQNADGAALNLYTWPAQMVANAILIKWDLSAIPAGATVEQATLHLFQMDSVGAGYSSSVHMIIHVDPVVSLATGYTYDGVNGWTPISCCFEEIPMAQADIARADSEVPLNRSDGYKSWDVTQMVSAWNDDASSNRGMLVNSDPTAASDDRRFFHSSEAVDAAVRPMLEITYRVP